MRSAILLATILVSPLPALAAGAVARQLPKVIVRSAALDANNVGTRNATVYTTTRASGNRSWGVVATSRGQKSAEFELSAALRKAACEVITDAPGDDPLEMHPENCRLLGQGNSAVIQSGDPAADRAYRNAIGVLSFYASVLNRFGLDGEGTPVTSIVHLGSNYDNAYWDPAITSMAYGDGDPDEREPTHDYTLARDVAGHEMTHGVISTLVQTHKGGKVDPGLNGSFENGALNEALADIMGILFARWHVRTADHHDPDQPWVKGGMAAQAWIFGQRAYKPSVYRMNEISFRPLDDSADKRKPGPGGHFLFEDDYGPSGTPLIHKYPTKYSEVIRCDGTSMAQQPRLQRQVSTGNNDFCSVHANAVLPGHLAYLITMQLERENLFGNSQASEAAVARLFFEMAARHLEPTADFHQMAASLSLTCAELFRQTPQMCGVVQAALRQVELAN